MAKVEVDLSGKKIVTTIALLVIGLVAGYLVAGFSAPAVGKDAGVKCISTQDLNRQDLIGVIQLSRFCEGLGLASNVLWQRDANGNNYALPVCVPANQ